MNLGAIANNNDGIVAWMNQIAFMLQGGGGSSVSLSNAITKLGQAPNTGGASTAFAAEPTGLARVTVAPTREIRFSISYSGGHCVMSGIPDDQNQLLSWSCTVHDETITINNRTYAVSHSVDALGRQRKSYTDGLLSHNSYARCRWQRDALHV
ncbi:MAG: hypothetical protein AAFN70_08345 [Planctomycetota bacterium]